MSVTRPLLHRSASRSPSADRTSTDDNLIPHSSYNEQSGKSTILIGHGAFSNRKEYDPVIPYLVEAGYHVLIPDLPAHGLSRSIQPFSLANSSAHLARLIRSKALGGRAHIVGLSLGAHVCVHLARTYPEVVDSVFASGYNLFRPARWEWQRDTIPYGIYILQHLQDLAPRSAVKWAMDGADLSCMDQGVCTVKLCKEICNALVTDTWPEPWTPRTLVVVGGKGDMIFPPDWREDGVRLLEKAEKGNQKGESKGVWHPGMRHPWNRQDPRLFAAAVDCWIQKKELPIGFEDLR